MSQIKHLIYEYQINGELDIDKLIDDFEGYIRTIINNIAMENLSYEDKEEILSDVFFIIWKNKEKITTTVEAYAAGITRILVKEKLRKKKITCSIDELENVVSTIDDLNENIFELESILNSIKNLKEIDIQILTLFYYEQRSTKEISKMLDISEMNVRTKLFRLRNKIRKEMNY